MVRPIANARGSQSSSSCSEFAAVSDTSQEVKAIVVITMEEPKNIIVAIVQGLPKSKVRKVTETWVMVAVKTYIRVVNLGTKVAATDREVTPGTYFKVIKASHTFANLNQ